MFNLKGIVVGSLAYIAVELGLWFRSIPSAPPPPEVAKMMSRGVVGYDLVTYFRNISGPMFWVGMIVFWSLASRWFAKVVILKP